MTDEEMAKEYCAFKFKSNESHFSKLDIEQAFLVGLKVRSSRNDNSVEAKVFLKEAEND